MGWMVVLSGSGPILLHKNLPHYYHEHTDLSDSFVHLFIHSSSAECPLYSRYWAKQKHTSRKFQLKLIRTIELAVMIGSTLQNELNAITVGISFSKSNLAT